MRNHASSLPGKVLSVFLSALSALGLACRSICLLPAGSFLGPDRSLISNAEVRNEWSYTSTTPYNFVACSGKNLPVLPSNVTSFLLILSQ